MANGRITGIIFIMAMATILVGCYRDKEEELYPNDFNCVSTDTPTYTEHIVPILESHCYACHSSENADDKAEGINLSNFSTLQGLANDGTLRTSVLQTGDSSPMPKNSSPLSTCKTDLIINWINNGALQN